LPVPREFQDPAFIAQDLGLGDIEDGVEIPIESCPHCGCENPRDPPVSKLGPAEPLRPSTA
jgi:hypothetical protein